MDVVVVYKTLAPCCITRILVTWSESSMVVEIVRRSCVGICPPQLFAGVGFDYHLIVLILGFKQEWRWEEEKGDKGIEVI
ncbi:unnamed protein product [Ilex paraguariensis]|uniref:Uncharacterized protein n=1 Tax=Ilex paraguariensis TaxID=185542 RepID=A0ABC8UGZ5_9AQUA